MSTAWTKETNCLGHNSRLKSARVILFFTSCCMLIMPSTCGPVVNIPVITGLVNQTIIEVQLFLSHVVQIFFSKEAKRRKRENKVEKAISSKRESDTKSLISLPKQNTVFQHAPLSALIEQPGSFGFYGLISSLLPWRQRDFNHVFLGICWAVTSVETAEWWCAEQRRR